MRGTLRLLTLNIHGEPEGRDAETLSALTDFICRERISVAALQEVCQSREAPPLASVPARYCACEPETVLREDLFVHLLAERLALRGENYFWSYLPIKLGYGKYDEGVAILSREPIAETAALTVSRSADYQSWKTRRLLGARTQSTWFYSVHFGWYDDPEEPFSLQWARARRGFLRHGDTPILLMGDFNSPAELRRGGYDLVAESGYHDAWSLADGEGATVRGGIDGWEENRFGLRVDQIWSSRPPLVGTARLVFDGRREPVVSDHFGVFVSMEGEW